MKHEVNIQISFILFFLLLIVGMVACNDDSYKGYKPPTEIENNSLVAILLSLGNTNYSVTTKGSGAIEGGEDDEIWDNSTVYIYSFLKDAATDFSRPMELITGEEDFKLPHCLIDGSRNTAGSQYGKPAKVSIANRAIEWIGNDNLYFPSSPDPYDFYGYYIDNINPTNIIRTSSSITLDIKIDGGNDLMSGTASLTNDQESDLVTNYSSAEQEVIRTALYSAYTGRRNFQPVMNFKHHLSRFKFQVYATREKSAEVTIKDIYIESLSHARFTVVDKYQQNIGVEFYGNPERLYLKEKNGASLKSGYNPIYKPEENHLPNFERTPLRVGESLLLPSTNEYKFYMIVSQIVRDKNGNIVLDEYGNPKEDELISPNTLRLTNGDIFEPGIEYTVRIAIYGLEDIEINVIPEAWQPGGTIDIDPEEDNY